MAIAFRNFGSSPGANSASCVITKPSGLAVGDFMIAHVMSKVTATEITPPANWTLVGVQVQTTAGRSGVFWKFADAADVAATTFTFTVGTGSNRGGIAAYTGVDTSAPINASNQQANTADTTIEIPLITPTVADTRILIFGGSDQEGTSSACSGTDPTCAEVWELVTTSGTDCGSHLWDAAKAVADEIDAHTITVSISAGSAGHAVALKPQGVTVYYGIAALSGLGALTGAGFGKAFGAAGLSGTGDLIAIGARLVFGTGTMSATGDLAALGYLVVLGAAGLAGQGGLTAAGLANALAAAAISGAGGLSAAGWAKAFGEAQLSGLGGLTASAGGAVYYGQVTLLGEGDAAGIGVRGVVAVSQLTGAGALTADAKATAFATAALAGLGQLIASGGIPGAPPDKWWGAIEYFMDLNPIVVVPEDCIGKL